MSTISKVFTILCLLCLCGNRESLVAFKQISNLFFHMNAQVYSVPDQTEAKRKAFFEAKKHRFVF